MSPACYLLSTIIKMLGINVKKKLVAHKWLATGCVTPCLVTLAHTHTAGRPCEQSGCESQVVLWTLSSLIYTDGCDMFTEMPLGKFA